MNLTNSKYPPSVHKNARISPQLVFFLIVGSQVGVGILGFVRYIAEFVNQDSWIIVIAGGLGVHLILWMMFSMLNKHGGDLFYLHHKFFGKWLALVPSLLFIVYILVTGIVVLRTYIEAVQNWMFPGLPTWAISLFFVALTYYIVSKGFRVVTGIAYFSFVLSVWLIFSHYFPIKFGHSINLLPVLSYSFKDYFEAFKIMVLSYVGIEYLFAYYPFLHDPKKAQKWAHIGAATTTFFYLLTTISTLMYFSPKQLQRLTWPTLMEWKIVTLPFIERFEYIGITVFAIVILINLALSLWSSSRGIHRMFDIKQRTALVLLSIILFVIPVLFTNRVEVDELNNMVGKVGTYLLYGYIPLLFLISLVKKGEQK
ncbi:spore germination protein [Fictibacillus nanhaiensis]|uniref:GerAB/ArcD/ProY family transporter n=1 Tax=Fictibacillus nanhaiensis TaxID=742169 RepID=UPI001C95EA23|nr:GerAB/ArcD/ProY family transporter [Fictibacillus nanhaiensis]MBY6035019.1 spore germination protein [Fictibacillus nanhaiensis]